MHNSLRDLTLERVFVIYPGERDYSLHARIEAVAVKNLPRWRQNWETS